MFIEKMSYTPDIKDGFHQIVMIFNEILDSARTETESEDEAYKLADHVFTCLMRSQQNEENNIDKHF